MNWAWNPAFASCVEYKLVFHQPQHPTPTSQDVAEVSPYSYGVSQIGGGAPTRRWLPYVVHPLRVCRSVA